MTQPRARRLWWRIAPPERAARLPHHAPQPLQAAPPRLYAPAPPAYGPDWGERRPPGLPLDVRRCSEEGAARRAVESAARGMRLGVCFVAFILELAEAESGCTYARPAADFDGRIAALGEGDAPRFAGTLCDGLRPADAPLVTRWGVFGWDHARWRHALRRPDLFPWMCCEADEINLPVRFYAALWRRALRGGGRALDAARAVSLWRARPEALRGLLEAAERLGWEAAWGEIPHELRGAVDARLSSLQAQAS